MENPKNIAWRSIAFNELDFHQQMALKHLEELENQTWFCFIGNASAKESRKSFEDLKKRKKGGRDTLESSMQFNCAILLIK